MACNKKVKLNQAPLLNFPKLCSRDDVRIVIYNVRHKFSTDAEYSGTDEKYHPIFGSQVYINRKLLTESTFGLPFIRFAKGSKPKIMSDNQTLFTTNIHYHGLNTDNRYFRNFMKLSFNRKNLDTDWYLNMKFYNYFTSQKSY